MPTIIGLCVRLFVCAFNYLNFVFNCVVRITLPDDVRNILAKCVSVQVVAPEGKGNSSLENDKVVILWDKFDGDVLQQLKTMKNHDAQVAASKRLFCLTNTTRIDNFASSLSGILRTIAKYGHEHLNKEDESGLNFEDKAALKRKTKADKESGDKVWKAILAEDGIICNEDDVDDR